MPAYRFYHPYPIEKGATYELDRTECHHLISVMRLSKGDELEVINGQGTLAQATLVNIEKNKAHIEVTETTYKPLSQKLVLRQALFKMSNLEWLVEKATELGVFKILLFDANKSSQALSENKKNRLEQKAIAALKQSGRLYLPEIKLIEPIDKWDEKYTNAFFGSLDSESLSMVQLLKQSNSLNELTFCSGPEAGFSEKEVALLNKKGFQGVTLHPNILRAETAPLVFLSLAVNLPLSSRNAPFIN